MTVEEHQNDSRAVRWHLATPIPPAIVLATYVYSSVVYQIPFEHVPSNTSTASIVFTLRVYFQNTCMNSDGVRCCNAHIIFLLRCMLIVFGVVCSVADATFSALPMRVRLY